MVEHPEIIDVQFTEVKRPFWERYELALSFDWRNFAALGLIGLAGLLKVLVG